MPDTMVEALRANAAIEPMLVDENTGPMRIGTRGHALSPSWCGRYCCATGIVGSARVIVATACRSIT